MFNDPLRVNAHMVGDHIRRETDAALPGTGSQVFQRAPAAEIFGDIVGIKGIRRSDGLRVTHPLLDLLAGARALPQTDQPESCETTVAQQIQFFIRDLVESPDPAAILS